jgi:hypothetical protein
VAHTIIGLFADALAVQRALTALGAAGFTRTQLAEAADQAQPARGTMRPAEHTEVASCIRSQVSHEEG